MNSKTLLMPAPVWKLAFIQWQMLDADAPQRGRAFDDLAAPHSEHGTRYSVLEGRLKDNEPCVLVVAEIGVYEGSGQRTEVRLPFSFFRDGIAIALAEGVEVLGYVSGGAEEIPVVPNHGGLTPQGIQELADAIETNPKIDPLQGAY